MFGKGSLIGDWFRRAFSTPTVGAEAIQKAHVQPSLEEEVASIVERSRNGDQVAMALITEVGHSAREGSKKAKHTFALIKRYIDKHPMGNRHDYQRPGNPGRIRQLAKAVQVAGDPEKYAAAVFMLIPVQPEHLNHAGVAVSNGIDLTSNASIKMIAAELDPDDRKAMFKGMRVAGDMPELKRISERATPKFRRILHGGYAIGLGRKIQNVRLPRVPLSHLSSTVGWEFGEHYGNL